MIFQFPIWSWSEECDDDEVGKSCCFVSWIFNVEFIIRSNMQIFNAQKQHKKKFKAVLDNNWKSPWSWSGIEKNSSFMSWKSAIEISHC